MNVRKRWMSMQKYLTVCKGVKRVWKYCNKSDKICVGGVVHKTVCTTSLCRNMDMKRTPPKPPSGTRYSTEDLNCYERRLKQTSWLTAKQRQGTGYLAALYTTMFVTEYLAAEGATNSVNNCWGESAGLMGIRDGRDRLWPYPWAARSNGEDYTWQRWL